MKFPPGFDMMAVNKVILSETLYHHRKLELTFSKWVLRNNPHFAWHGLRMDIECLCGNGFLNSVFHSYLAIV